MEVLRGLRRRGDALRLRWGGSRRVGVALGLLGLAALTGGCGADAELRPDAVLQEELGLTRRDRVHRVVLSRSETEVAVPPETHVREGDYVAFVTGDGFIHEVRFELDSLDADARAFLEETDQVDSPPLVDRGSRFVVDFHGAPAGRYPFRLEGNAATGRGVVIVGEKP